MAGLCSLLFKIVSSFGQKSFKWNGIYITIKENDKFEIYAKLIFTNQCKTT
jgi:hypothetical protein